jgi:hypothetical protein
VLVDRDPDQQGDEDEHPLKLTIIPPTTPPKPKAEEPEPEKVGVAAKGSESDEPSEEGGPASDDADGASSPDSE